MGCQRTRKAQIGSCNKCLCLILFLNKKKIMGGVSLDDKLYRFGCK